MVFYSILVKLEVFGIAAFSIALIYSFACYNFIVNYLKNYQKVNPKYMIVSFFGGFYYAALLKIKPVRLEEIQ